MKDACPVKEKKSSRRKASNPCCPHWYFTDWFWWCWEFAFPIYDELLLKDKASKKLLVFELFNSERMETATVAISLLCHEMLQRWFLKIDHRPWKSIHHYTDVTKMKIWELSLALLSLFQSFEWSPQQRRLLIEDWTWFVLRCSLINLFFEGSKISGSSRQQQNFAAEKTIDQSEQNYSKFTIEKTNQNNPFKEGTAYRANKKSLILLTSQLQFC